MAVVQRRALRTQFERENLTKSTNGKLEPIDAKALPRQPLGNSYVQVQNRNRTLAPLQSNNGVANSEKSLSSVTSSLDSGHSVNPTNRNKFQLSPLDQPSKRRNSDNSGFHPNNPSAIYGHSVVNESAVPANPVNTILLQIGKAVHELSDPDAIYDISTRGRIDNLLGPLELQARLTSLFNIRLNSHEAQLLMKRFGTSGVSRDRVDLNELLAWARSAYERSREIENYENAKKKTKKEVEQLMARNHVLSKIERNKMLEAEFQKKIELKLSLSALSILEGDDKGANLLENTDALITVAEFKNVLNQMGIFLSNLEFSSLVNAFVIEGSSTGSTSKWGSHNSSSSGGASVSSSSGSRSATDVINFDGFRGYMTSIMQESIAAAKQKRAVQEFKASVETGPPPELNFNRSSAVEVIAEGDEESYDNDGFESEETSLLKSNIRDTERALMNSKSKHKFGSGNNLSSSGDQKGLGHSDRNSNSVKLLHQDSLSLGESVGPDMKPYRVSEKQPKRLPRIGRVTGISSEAENQTQAQAPTLAASGPARRSVRAVVNWISDPLNGL